MADVVYVPTDSGGGGGSDGSIGSGGGSNGGYGGSVSTVKVDLGIVKENVEQSILAGIEGTAKPTTVELPDIHFEGNAETILDAYGIKLDEVENPYNKPYLVGYEESVDSVNYAQDGVMGTLEYTTYTPIYENSEAFNEFEKALKNAKEIVHKEWLLSVMSPPDEYDNGYSVSFTTSEDDFGKPYGDTPPYTGNVDVNKPSKPKVGGDTIAEVDTDNWKITFNWIPSTVPNFPPSRSGNYNYSSGKTVVENMIDGSVNDWFAGGKLYDSPRAGGAYFNELGDMNTVRFLGLEDKNFNAHLSRRLRGMAEVHKMLGVDAGTTSSYEQSSTSKLYYAHLASTPTGDIVAKNKDTEFGHTNKFVPVYKDQNIKVDECVGDKTFCNINKELAQVGDDISAATSDASSTIATAANDIGDTVANIFGW